MHAKEAKAPTKHWGKLSWGMQLLKSICLNFINLFHYFLQEIKEDSFNAQKCRSSVNVSPSDIDTGKSWQTMLKPRTKGLKI
jgi:hypothetical protein